MPNFLEKTIFPNKFNKSNLIGLSLSGGGYRSAIFCFGVLKKLHELGYLSKIDYLSTISGGSWIGTSYSVTKNLDDFFKGDILQKNLENHILDAPLKSIPITQNWVSDWLANSLSEDFLFSITNNALLKKEYFDIESKPFLIAGASFIEDNKNNRIDLTPLYSYSKKYETIKNEYMKTPSNNNLVDFKVSHTIACSGAALGFDIASIGLFGARTVLFYKLQPSEISKVPFNKFNLVLRDGGHYENLGLEALIDRDCNKIIICDAESDSEKPNQEFEGLKTFFKNMNLKFPDNILDILDKPNESVKSFNLTISTKTFEIIYIKLKKINSYQNGKKLDKDFPHYETKKLKYSKDEFDNLSGLGEYIIESNKNIFENFFK